MSKTAEDTLRKNIYWLLIVPFGDFSLPHLLKVSPLKKVIGCIGNLLLSVAALGITGSLTTTVYAQSTETYIGFGAGVNGANRRVRTAAGAPNQPWVRAKGLFTEPTGHYVPNPAANIYHSSPDMYLGSGGAVEVDAGLHFESAQRGAPYGWTLFISQGGNYTFCGRGATVYRCDKRQLGTVTLTYRILVNGGVELDANIPEGGDTLKGHYHMFGDNDNRNAGDEGPTNAAAVYPVAGGGVITNQALANMTLKRVIALSQSDPGGGSGSAFIDSSYMWGAVWSMGELSFPRRGTNGLFLQNGGRFLVSSSSWGATSPELNLAETGLVPRGRDDQDNWIVDYPQIRPAVDSTNGGYRMAWSAASTRYTNEKVDINLRMGRSIRGRPVVRRVAR